MRQQFQLMYEMGGVFATNAGLPVTGNSLVENAGPCAAADMTVLNAFPQAKAALGKVVGYGGFAGLVVAHLPIITAMRYELNQRQAAFNPPAEG